MNASNTSFFGELLGTIADRGRALLEMGREKKPAGAIRAANIIALCEQLLSGRGEASGVALAQEILARYGALKTGERIAFFEALAETFGPEKPRLEKAIAAYGAKPSDKTAAELHAASEPRRQELIRRLNLAPGATADLVAMRAALLEVLARRADLAAVDRDFTHLFTSWFNRGFLVLRRIDWSTPASVLEKIIRYEAVHAIRDWNDLRARVDSPDRRCYAFFHPALVDEPLIFVEVALMREIPGAIAPVLEEDRATLDPAKATTAVFYSISNCQPGLGGVSFGNFLIKQVVEEISRELPALKSFVTLSPVPGFRGWLEAERRNPASIALTDADRLVLESLDEPGLEADEARQARLRPVLCALAAHFFLIGRTAKGRPLDPVARFHLGNGARLERINPFGDLSPKGLRQAAGLMVNYRYMLDEIEANHETFFDKAQVVASPAVKKLLRPDIQQKALAVTTGAGNAG